MGVDFVLIINASLELYRFWIYNLQDGKGCDFYKLNEKK